MTARPMQRSRLLCALQAWASRPRPFFFFLDVHTRKLCEHALWRKHGRMLISYLISCLSQNTHRWPVVYSGFSDACGTCALAGCSYNQYNQFGCAEYEKYVLCTICKAQIASLKPPHTTDSEYFMCPCCSSALSGKKLNKWTSYTQRLYSFLTFVHHQLWLLCVIRTHEYTQRFAGAMCIYLPKTIWIFCTPGTGTFFLFFELHTWAGRRGFRTQGGHRPTTQTACRQCTCIVL